MSTERAGVGIIGAGMISGMYLDNMRQFPDLELKAIADLDLDRAAEKAQSYGMRAQSVEDLLSSDDIEIVINLTIPAVHFEVSMQILASGKHVWSEKPITLSREDAATLLQEARNRGLRSACAPDTFLGAALQTAQREILNGLIGRPTSAMGIVQSPGPERVHPNPAFLYDDGAGPTLDMGPYYVTAFIQMMGPVQRVASVPSTARKTRQILVGPNAGTEFEVKVPSQDMALLEFASGATATLITSFECGIRRNLFEVSGTDGTLVVPNPNFTEGDLTLFPMIGEPKGVPAKGSIWGRGVGVVDLARSIRSGQEERASGTLALHVLDVLLAIQEAGRERRWIQLSSANAAPVPLSEDWDPTAATI
ncbi:Gfo/Idh/MocA family protein [Arthrobacter rhizosphaerae]|uniref:Gfo/Idh/MocA family protein n=1 Tax=Arthrobacter rhizosphaerae TaxID=2855490 RepID=UPI001FF38908|nr:Gfo/Idh/MocA family oxidoreductase [Arthrobacter rhizosphaerae]